MAAIWCERYTSGVPAEIDLTAYSSLVDLFETACRRYAREVAFLSFGQSMTYAELDSASAAFAGYLQSLGLAPGARVALMMPNVLQYPVALFGCLRAGCVVVNCNPLYTPRELGFQLQDSGAEAIVVVENFAHTVQQVLPQTMVRHVVVTSVGELLGGVKGRLLDAVLKFWRKAVPPWCLPGAVRFRAALALGERYGVQPVSLGHEDLAFLQYTGGTTGVAKGAMLSHGNVLANALQANAWVKPVLGERQECVLTALPLFHIFALTANCLTFLMLGARNILVANPRDLPGLLKIMRKHPVTVVTGVNTLFHAMLETPGFSALDFSVMKLALGGGMAVQASVAERWQSVTGSPMLQAYGLTETSPAVTINPLHLQAFDGSVGVPISSTDLSVRDAQGIEMPTGEVGEICVRGPQVMRGYWRQPEETAHVFLPDGFMRTGDLGYVDAGGCVYLVDRKKDVILVSGFNVFPGEVEGVLLQHPAVAEAVVLGVPDAHSGEAIKAYVVLRHGVSEAELLVHCRSALTPYKVPRSIEYRVSLPKTVIGKISRRALREEANGAAG